ncbi:MAG TPA: Zn-dependent protease with chaperone function [Cyanothece sp. UBA12306]|nr:Zn-dependent protease with chaperone function [Cyanothece sp. UBA12306]
MHLLMIIIALSLAGVIRFCTPLSLIGWTTRWQRSLFYFVFPPLLLLMTTVAIVVMGYHGTMLGWQSSLYSYLLAVTFLIFAIISLIKLAYQGWQSIKKINGYPEAIIAGKKARIIDIPVPYSAQIGFWNPEMVVSQELLNTLDQDHLMAVIAHEEAHANYQDTFWFFLLGWLGRITFWLPHTNNLWQDLLLIREIRADQQASQQVDPLLIAESLVIVARKINNITLNNSPEIMVATFHDKVLSNRLNERIDALLTESENNICNSLNLSYIFLTFVPLVFIPFHC